MVGRILRHRSCDAFLDGKAIIFEICTDLEVNKGRWGRCIKVGAYSVLGMWVNECVYDCVYVLWYYLVRRCFRMLFFSYGRAQAGEECFLQVFVVD